MDILPSPFHRGAGRSAQTLADLPLGGYCSGRAHNIIGIQGAFANLAQVAAEDCVVLTNLVIKNTNAMEQVGLCSNCLSSKEVDNKAL